MKLLESICLKVEIHASCHISDATSDLCELSNRIGVLIEADFNGVTLMAKPGDDPKKIADSYAGKLGSKLRYKIASANGF